jgi:hypothetical protein
MGGMTPHPQVLDGKNLGGDEVAAVCWVEIVVIAVGRAAAQSSSASPTQAATCTASSSSAAYSG